MTRIHAGDGRLLAEYAREKRVFVPVEAMPERVKQAFIAAEDKSFYSHPGIDLLGIGRAVLTTSSACAATAARRGRRPSPSRSPRTSCSATSCRSTRKIKEAILALRMERAFTKDHILELYLNEIFLGNRSYGVAAAALNYFDKSLDELTHRRGGLARRPAQGALDLRPAPQPRGRPAAPQLRHRPDARGRLHHRRRGRGGARRADRAARRRRRPSRREADFFIEEVRRQLVDRAGRGGVLRGRPFGARHRLLDLQALADQALRHGLAAYDRRHGWRGPWGRLDLAQAGDAWAARLAALDPGFELGDWRRGVVLGARGERVEIGLETGERIRLAAGDVAWSQARSLWSAGDLVLMEPRARPSATAPPGACGSGRRSRVRWWRSTRTPAACWR